MNPFLNCKPITGLNIESFLKQVQLQEHMTQEQIDKEVSRKEVWSWSLYDFANSGYASVIPVLLFPLYYKALVLGNSPNADLWWGLTVGISVFLAGILSPVIGAWADVTKRRKAAFVLSSLLAILGTVALAITGKLGPLLITLVFITTNTSFNIALTLYDSLMFNVSNKSNSGKISGLGWALGNAGGMLCTLLIYPFLNGANSDYVVIFLMVAVFYLIFSLPSFFYVKETELFDLDKSKTPLRDSLKKVFGTIKNWRKNKTLIMFLAAFYFFSEGIVTLSYFGALYATSTLGLSQKTLAILFILQQLIAIPSTFLICKKADKIGYRKVLLCTTLGMAAIILLFAIAKTATWMYIVIPLSGLVGGSSQATARAWFKTLVPHKERSEWFGFNALASKVSAMLGPILFGIISTATGSQRLAIGFTGIYFLVSLAIFIKIKK